MAEKWKNWSSMSSYGEILYKRALGELPEMESAKSMADELKSVYKTGDTVLDVGCGAGHYLRSYRRECGNDFSYTGVDATAEYIELAKKAWQNDKNAQFKVGDIFKLDLPDSSYDIVSCSNVLLHLPSVDQPLEELVRVAKKTLLVRLLCGDRTFIIKDVRPNDVELDRNGEPTEFNYFNIYSEAHIKKVLSRIKKVKSVEITQDVKFDLKGISNSANENRGAYNATTILGNHQINGFVLLPWAILRVNF